MLHLAEGFSKDEAGLGMDTAEWADWEDIGLDAAVSAGVSLAF